MRRIFVHIPRNKTITICDFTCDVIEPRCNLCGEMIPRRIINNDAVKSIAQDPCKPVAATVQEQVADVAVPVMFREPPNETQNHFLFQIIITSLSVKYR